MNPPRRVLIASDKFKGSLTAAGACDALARGLAARFPGAAITRRPIADGGEGFAESLQGPLAGAWVEFPACDALGRPVAARYLLAGSGADVLAVMEMADTCGLWRIAARDRDILRAHTLGTGVMMRHAVLENRVTRLIVGIGGSATNDGGAGMAAALGIRFLDAAGRVLDPSPATLAGRLARVDENGAIPLPPVTVACDVENPLLGRDGATRVYGPQKGADEVSTPILEQALADLVRASGGEACAARPGAGAAGGLGFGLMRFANAELVPGFELMAELTGLERAVMEADLVVTGEGSLDVQSLSGKGPVALARMARGHGKPVIAFCGRTDAAARASGLFDAIHELSATGLPKETLMARAGELLAEISR